VPSVVIYLLKCATINRPKIVANNGIIIINIQLCQKEYIFSFILSMYFRHKGMSTTKIFLSDFFSHFVVTF